MAWSWCSLSVLGVDGVDQFEGREAVPRVDRESSPVLEGCGQSPVELGVVAGDKRQFVRVRVGPDAGRCDGATEPRVAGAHPAGELPLLRVEPPGDEARARTEHAE